jgi:8-oxo-dGTP diphosphatase
MTVVVAAAVIEDHGRYFLTRRPAGSHLAGLWEFPGGKVEPGESLVDGLRRELREELGAEVEIDGELLAAAHDYPDRRVELHFLTCRFLNSPVARLGQEMRWVEGDKLGTLTFPPADLDLVRLLERRTAADE